jgi:hypothetical protein
MSFPQRANTFMEEFIMPDLRAQAKAEGEHTLCRLSLLFFESCLAQELPMKLQMDNDPPNTNRASWQCPSCFTPHRVDIGLKYFALQLRERVLQLHSWLMVV